MEVIALMASMDSLVFASLHSPEELVRSKWTLVAPTLVTTMLLVPLLRTIETFSAHVLLGSREDFAMKILTNAPKTILVVMEELALTLKEGILANVDMDMKVEIV